jgi:hypothetical protein
MPTHSKLAAAAARRDSLQRLQNRIAVWQAKTFPKQTTASKLKGLVREVELELIPDLDDRKEWADVFIYFLGAAAMEGITARELIEAAHAKMDKNIMRKWGPPDAAGLYHHTEEGK